MLQRFFRWWRRINHDPRCTVRHGPALPCSLAMWDEPDIKKFSPNWTEDDSRLP